MLKLVDLLLMLAVFEAIVCASRDMFTTRHNRSSFSETSEQLQNNEFHPIANKPRSSLNSTNWGIFIVGTEKYPVLFNKSVVPQLRHGDEMHADDATIIQPSKQEPSFKVQRLPDGKLSLVFNDLPFLQPPTLTAHNRQLAKNDAIVFPDRRNNFRDNVRCLDPANAGKSFCTEVHDYPSSMQLDNLLRSELFKYESFFFEDLAQPTNVTQRMNYEPEDLQLCKSREHVVYPKAAETLDSKWLLIANYKDRKQGILVEECETAGSLCEIISGILPNHYRATCKQNYSYRQLVAIKDNATTLTTDHFKMPSCCKCVLRQDGN